MDEKKKYKVIHPTNGLIEGDIVELTETEAANYNGGEPKPRVVLVEEGSEAAPPAGGESAAGGEGEGTSNETDISPSSEGGEKGQE